MFVQLWSDLVPLVLASAVLPLQTVVALVLVRQSLRSAVAWVAGMLAVRLLQGAVFGWVLGPGEGAEGSEPRYVLGALLLVLALLLYVKAARAALGAEDEDAPPPKWVARVRAMAPAAAFGMGAVFMAVSVKFLVFTWGAIGAIAGAHMSLGRSALVFALFVVFAHGVPLTILLLGASSSPRASALLEGALVWLRRNERTLNVAFGVIFGTWFLLKAGARLGVL